MANAGNSKDCLLISNLIKLGNTIKIYDNDHFCAIKIKTLINNLIESDRITNKTYNSKIKYVYHSAWEKKHKILIKINQIRVNNFYYKDINL